MLISDFGMCTTIDILGGVLTGVVKISSTVITDGEANPDAKEGDDVMPSTFTTSSEYSNFLVEGDIPFLCLAFGIALFHVTESDTYIERIENKVMSS